jgi:flagellar hook assembly protein FlgD
MLKKAGNFKIEIYDIQGRLVSVAAEGKYAAGEHTVIWQNAALPAGNYIAKAMDGNTLIKSLKLTKN